jgi:hypothetical protein
LAIPDKSLEELKKMQREYQARRDRVNALMQDTAKKVNNTIGM